MKIYKLYSILSPGGSMRCWTLVYGLSSCVHNLSTAAYNEVLGHLDETLKGLCCSGRLLEAVAILCTTKLQVYPQTYSLLLQECIFRKEFKTGRTVHAQMIIVGFLPNIYLNTKLLILYAKAGDLETAQVIFDRLPSKSLVSYNVMISGYVQKGLDEVGLSLYNKMRQKGLTADQFTFASIFRACASLARLEQGKQAHGVMIKSKIRENVVVNSSLMDMYFKCSTPSDGQRVFDKSLDKNVITWTSLISGHGGLVNEGWGYFSSMKRDYGIKPREKHFAAMVDLLGRAGRVKEAYDFVQSSSCEDHSVIWGALLGACRMHGDMELLKIAAKKFFELDPENAGKYVVLSNAYAAFGSWVNVAEVRGLMRELRVKKEPGYSWIEVQTEVHVFYMGDNCHKHTEQTYEMIKKITVVIRDPPIVPDPDLTGVNK